MDKNRSKNFRYVFANTFSIRLADNDITISFGIDEGTDTIDMMAEVAIIMTPKTARLLSEKFSDALKRLESDADPTT